MTPNRRFLYNYIVHAPMALAIERTLECRIIAGQAFQGPVLDIGCGDGLFAFVLFADRIDVGVDPDGRELQRAGQLGRYRELIQSTGDKINKKSGSFNTILSNSVLEHIPAVQGVLHEAHRLLSPTGRFYITVPTDRFDKYSVMYQVLTYLNLRRAAERYRRFFNRFWKHHHCYSIAGWQDLLRQCGFEVVQSRLYNPKAICLVNDFLAPFGFAAFLAKKLFNRWILLPNLRRFYIIPLYIAARYLIDRHGLGKNGGIVFFELKKMD